MPLTTRRLPAQSQARVWNRLRGCQMQGGSDSFTMGHLIKNARDVIEREERKWKISTDEHMVRVDKWHARRSEVSYSHLIYRGVMMTQLVAQPAPTPVICTSFGMNFVEAITFHFPLMSISADGPQFPCSPQPQVSTSPFSERQTTCSLPTASFETLGRFGGTSWP